MSENLNPSDAGSWLDWITNFDQTYQNFSDNWQALQSLQGYVTTMHPELLGQYNDLVTRGSAHAQTLAQLKATRDYVWSWLQWLNSGVANTVDFVSTTAQGAYDAAKRALGLGDLPYEDFIRKRNQFAGLGIAPLVVIGLAAAVAALVVIGYWIKDAYAFAQRLNALQAQEQQLIAGGVPAADAARQAQAIVDNTLGPAPGTAASIDQNLLGIPWTWIITGAVLVFLGPPIVEAFAEGGKRRGA